jgi:hypothetical protein
LGTLIEEARTNLLTYSEDFSNVAWTKTCSSIGGDAIIVPDGSSVVCKLTEDTSTDLHFVAQNFLKNAQFYTASVFAKKAELRYVDVGLSGAVNWEGVPQGKFDLLNGTVQIIGTSATGTIEDVGNGWFRCSITSESSNTTGSGLSISANNDSSVIFPSYTGDGTSGLYIWGAQLEAGAFPTSYIPTTTAAVTRNADVITMTGTDFSDWYNQSEGCLFVNVNRLSPVNINFAPASIGTGVSDFLTIQNLSTNSQWTTRARATGDNPFVTTALLGTDTPAKIAFGMSRTEYTASINGAAVVTYSPSGTPVYPEANSLKIGTNQTVSTPTGAGHIKQLQYYPRRLTNTQLQALSA